MKATIERSYLLRRQQTWEIELPDGSNVMHMMTEHFDDFDEDLQTRGTFLGEVDQVVDEDDLTLTLIDDEPPPAEEGAVVIPFRQRGETSG